MYFKDLLPALQIGKLHRNAAVKTPRSGQCRVKRFGTVCRSQDNDACIALKSIHFCQELIERLFAFVISSDLTVTLFTDRIDLVDEYNTRSFLLCLFEQISHLGSAHSYEHLDKF